MKQQNQVKLLIISCFFILAGLISIQYFLVRNVYDLEKRNYQQEVRKTIEPVSDAPELDVLQDTLQESIKKLVFKKITDSLSEQQFRTLLFRQTDSIRKLGNLFIKSQEKDYPILKEVRLRYQYTEIIFKNDSIIDSILTLTQNPLVYFGHELEKKEFFNLSYGNWYNNSSSKKDDEKGGVQNEAYWFSIRHTVDVDLSNWEYKVLLRMKWILIAAIGLLVAVIILFFWMYRSLIKQKKIAEVKTDFANNITHELKTPMASLALIIKSLKNEEINQNPEKRMELIHSLERQNKRIQNITDRVLESSMNYQNELKKENIVRFLKEISSDFKTETHTFQTEIEPGELYLKTDLSQLERVIQNILENAQKYSPRNSGILLKSYESNSEYIIEIHDQGKGIPANEHKKVFDKFYRVSEDNKHNTKGLGLGLYLSKQIIENLGGTISVRSKLGGGSTFILKIPIV